MNPEQRRDLLRAVANGDVTPAEAAEQLGRNPDDDPRPASDPGQRRKGQGPTGDDSVERIRVRALGAEVTIIGDPSVATIEIDGDHQLWSEGTTLVVRVDDSALEHPQRGGHRSRPRRKQRPQWMGDHKGPRATIRVNPELPLRVGGHLSAIEITSMAGPLAATVNMGMLTLRQVTAPFDATLRAGRLKVSGRLTYGDSTIRTSMSKVDILLDADSDVAVRTAIDRGQVNVHLPKRQRPAKPGCFVVGEGVGTLDLNARMGSISLAVGERAAGSRR